MGCRMMGYYAATLYPCPPCHPWAACAISLQSRAFSWRASRLDQVRKNCLRTPCREGSRGSLFGTLHELYAFFHKLRCMWRVGRVQPRPWSTLE